MVLAARLALAAWPGPTRRRSTEGEVVVYTAAQSTIVQAVGPMFEKKTGIKVSFVEAGTGEILKRARAEAANPLGDVLWALGAEGMAANADLLEPYTVADDAKIAAIYKKGMADGRITPNNVTPMVIVYNKKLLPRRRGPEELAEPWPTPAGRTRSPTRRPTSRGRPTPSWRRSSPCSATTTRAGRSSRTS